MNATNPDLTMNLYGRSFKVLQLTGKIDKKVTRKIIIRVILIEGILHLVYNRNQRLRIETEASRRHRHVSRVHRSVPLLRCTSKSQWSRARTAFASSSRTAHEMEGGSMLDYRIVEKASFTIVGMKRRFNADTSY
jgi:hypothetical protein